MKEEIEINIKVGKYLGLYITSNSKKVTKWFECFSETDEAKPTSDLDEIRWIPKKEAMIFINKKVKAL